MTERAPDDYFADCPDPDCAGTSQTLELTKEEVEHQLYPVYLWICGKCGFEWLGEPTAVAWAG